MKNLMKLWDLNHKKETVEVKDILTKVYSALEKKVTIQKSNNRLHSIWRSYLYY